jgi:hypothetical protein
VFPPSASSLNFARANQVAETPSKLGDHFVYMGNEFPFKDCLHSPKHVEILFCRLDVWGPRLFSLEDMWRYTGKYTRYFD